jgi:cell division septation protein DedD
MDPDTRRLMIFAGGLGAVLAVLISASGLIGHHRTEVPVITADTRPIRVKPDNPGGMKIDGAENDVFSAGSDTADSRLAPPAEDPDAKALGTVAASQPVAAQAPTVAPPPSVEKPAEASVAETPALSAPVARSPVAVSAPSAKPAPVPPAKPKPTGLETHANVSDHQAMVQLAALSSQEAARNEWQQLSKRMPALLNGKQPVYSRTERDGHTFWRVRTAGFGDTVQARTFCDHVRAKGAGCSVADF